MARGTDYSAYEAITVSSASVGLTTATILGKESAVLTVETAVVRFRLDGAAPTSSEGHVLEVGDVLELDSSESLANVRFIRRDGTSATLRCSYGD